MTGMMSLHLMITTLVGCSPEEKQLCERLDECNAIEGISVSECTDDLDDSLEDLTDSDEKDCRAEINRCLENASCDNFAICALTEALPKCGSTLITTYYTGTTTPTGGGGGGGGGGNADCQLGAEAYCFCLEYYYPDYACTTADVSGLALECENGTGYGAEIQCFSDYVDGSYVDCYAASVDCL